MAEARVAIPRTWSFGLNHLLRIRDDQLAFYDDMRRQHGDVVRLRLGPYRSWLLFSPGHVEQVLTRHWASFIRFEKLTRIVAQWAGDSMLLSEGPAWRERRRKLLPAFKTSRLPGYGEKAVLHATRFCERLDGMAPRRLAIDTDAEMARLTLDIAFATFFDADPPANGDEVERAIRILSETAFRESTSLVTLPDALPLRAKRRKRWAMAIMDDLVLGLVRARLGEPASDRGDLLSILLAEHGREERPIRDDVMSLLIAGHETSGSLLAWTFLCLARKPHWRGRLVAELEAVLGGRRPEPSDVARLPLLRATLEETLRLYPPAYSLFLRRATRDVALDDGLSIRRGDLVQITPYALQRDPRFFPEPDRYDPERFLGEPTWPRYAYIPFGAGPRVCIGQAFGLLETCLAVAVILQRWHPVEAPASVVPEPQFSLRPRGGVPLVWQRAAASIAVGDLAAATG